MRLLFLAFALSLPAAAAEAPTPLKIRALDGGGFAIENAPAVNSEVAKVSLASLAPLLAKELPDAEKIDFTQGKKLDGAFTITVARADGTLGKYEDATDVFIFARTGTLQKVQDVTTLDGAVVFALKIDNTPTGVPEQRLEQGAITLTPDEKSI